MKVTCEVRRLLILVLVSCTAHAVVCTSSSLYGNETDRLSLLGFKDAISLDPQQVFVSWNDSTHFCNWEGVLCTATTPRRVYSLNLTKRGLVGHISPSLGNMSFLQALVIMGNTLSGEIPPTLGQLYRLQIIRLNNNTLQGRIPSFANCSKLRIIDVSFNHLVGDFPANLPPNIEVLVFWSNNITGTIPASLSNITTLATITFTYNHIKGNIPSEFADLSSLQYLQAGANDLTGRFPQALLNLSNLVVLSIPYNGLSGEVPPNLFTSLPNVQVVQLGVNFFQGHIPSSFANASGISYFDLMDNNFTGVVPAMIGKLTKLSWLNLGHNQLQAQRKEDWDFLDSLGNCTELKLLSMNQNLLSGHVPSSIGNLSNQLERLYLGNNKLSGGFPSGLANLRNLIVVALWGNWFTGVVPKWIGTLKTLQLIDLNTNFFTGTIPSSFSNLSSLGNLYLHSNLFIGQIPSSFGNIPMLQDLFMSSNNLHGRIPAEILRISTLLRIDLSFNNLDGKLLTDICKPKQLLYLGLSSNKLSGDIPNSLGDCESLEYIFLESNIFSGTIPTSLGNITSLIFLNLSTNDLTGSIPISLSNLQYLEEIDLSFNHLEGEVPTKGVFSNASAVRIDGNKGLCGGASKLHMQACVVMPSNSTRKKKSFVLKLVIPIGSMLLLAMVIFGIYLWRDIHKRKTMSLPSFAAKIPKVSFNDLSRATEGFTSSNLIGRGGYSSVYKGKLRDEENEVAIKVFNLEARGAHKSFIAECNALKNVRHRNLVPIQTVCSSIDSNSNDFKALVYGFMHRGDLHKLLYSGYYEGSSVLKFLTMIQRMSIVVDVADAMEYLHHSNQQTIVHCDLKPSNILLDDNMTAHVGDFGLARFKVSSKKLSIGNPNFSSVGLVGTIGYAAPEYAGGGQVSTAGDVYSFGVILLEIFLRRRPTDDMFKDGFCIVKFTETNFPERVMEIVDPELIQELQLCQETPMALNQKGVHSLLCMLNIGLCCTKPSPSERINMQEVATKLHGIRDAYLRGN